MQLRKPPKPSFRKRRVATKDVVAFIARGGELEVVPGSKIIRLDRAAARQLMLSGLTRVRYRPRVKSAATKGEATRSLKAGASAMPVIKESAFAPGPRAKAILRGLEIAEEDLRSSGGCYDLKQVRELMRGVTRQSIDKRVREGSLLAVLGPGNKRHYPVVQFKNDGTVVDGLRDVLEALPTTNGFAALNFLIHPDHRLGDRKPIELLKAGEVGLVVEAARRMGEQGA